MEFLFFYLAVVAACLLWSAAFTAAGARTRPGLVRRMLVLAAVAVPVLSLLPWVLGTGLLAFRMNIEPNLFAPTVTAAIAAAVGGVCIAWAGLKPRVAPAATEWPLLTLAAMFVLAKFAAAGALLLIDSRVRADARTLPAEAAAVMQSIVLPAPSIDEDAAPLYRRAVTLIESDASLRAKDSPLADVAGADMSAGAVTGLIRRHATTLELLSHAADKPSCRFDRDWSRPSFDMAMPELGPLRDAGRLLALAARHDAFVGDLSGATYKIKCLRRLAAHLGSEPCLIAGVVAAAFDRLATETLVAILPAITPDDASVINTVDIDDFLRSPPSLFRHMLGEEAFGLVTFAAWASAERGASMTELVAASESGDSLAPWASEPLGLMYRCFVLPDDIASYRHLMKEYRHLAQRAGMPGERWTALIRRAEVLDGDTPSPGRGMLTTMLTPALSAAIKNQVRVEALHRAAEVLVAATQYRLANGALPESAEKLMSQYLSAVPRDPFLNDGPLVVKIRDDGWFVYSVGPDGKDDGGPSLLGKEKQLDSDDVGLILERAR